MTYQQNSNLKTIMELSAAVTEGLQICANTATIPDKLFDQLLDCMFEILCERTSQKAEDMLGMFYLCFTPCSIMVKAWFYLTKFN